MGTKKQQTSDAASIMGKKGGATRKKQLGVKGLRKMGSEGGKARARNLKRKLSTGKKK